MMRLMVFRIRDPHRGKKPFGERVMRQNDLNDAFILAEILGKKLQQKNCRLTTSESCTGGGLAYALTSVSGSSAWFDQGIVSYSNEVKHRLLSVPESILTLNGAVSEPVVAAMAQGSLCTSGSDIALSISGIAGPDGGSKDKPIGTVCFGLCDVQGRDWQRTVHFSGDRNAVREQAIVWSLQAVINHLDVL